MSRRGGSSGGGVPAADGVVSIHGIPAPAHPGVHGVIRAAAFGSVARRPRPGRYVTELVNGAGYHGMTDNDLRGFLDGTVTWGWNQATQVHVRVGRTYWPGTPTNGEHEVFRVLQRWDGLPLPPLARVVGSRMEVQVEAPPPAPMRLLLYAVRRDWGPGAGGIHRNNVSPPETGEVWWCAARHGEEAWGLPGAGFASDGDTEADTGVAPLAQVVCGPETTHARFESGALTAYAAERVAAELPLLFLLKAADAQEDVPGAFLSLYSAEHGDSKNVATRPRLVLEWESPAEQPLVEAQVSLEHGRAVVFERVPVTRGERIVAEFHGEPGFEAPLLELRTGCGDEAHSWRPIGPGTEADGDWAQLRVRAVENPVPLGSAFEAELVDTWVASAPAERQAVRWTFVSPTGREQTLDAQYDGGFRWSVTFMPDEPGRWRYRWAHQFFTPVAGPPGRFDVVAGEPDALKQRLEVLAREVERARASERPSEVHRLGVVFSRLERMAMSDEHPHRFRETGGPSLREALRDARSALCGAAVPYPSPLVAHPLLTEVAGRRLRDPIPDIPEFDLARPRGASASLRRVLGRAVRWITS